ncbi:hypothetical protein [Halobacteriovorax marinus]|uniref:hypothetical protein n=1 Tax=Halobacteriovorax marinus TaxID=97084 RepID=UPI003A946881
MRIAVDNTPMGEYKLIGRDKNNCQDWADRVRLPYSNFENSYFIDRNSFGLDTEFNFDIDLNMSNEYNWGF